MELVDERQTLPLAVTGAFTFVLMVGTYGLLAWTHPPQATANTLYWYIARTAGFLAYELLALTALLGVSGTSALWAKWKAGPVVARMHQFASLMVFPILVLHVWALHQDSTVPFAWPALLIPLRAAYRPFATGLGVLSLYLMVVLVLSSILRAHLGVRVWRTLHYLSFPLFLMITVHGLLSGSDSAEPWAPYLYFVPLITFTLLTMRRVLRANGGPPPSARSRSGQMRR